MKTTRFYKIYDTTGLHIANIKKTYDNLANLIATNYSEDLTIYDDRGEFIVSTFGCFLNRVCDGDTRLKILDKLMPLQLGEKEPKDIIYVDIDWR